MKISVYNRPLNQLEDESYSNENPQKKKKVSVFALGLTATENEDTSEMSGKRETVKLRLDEEFTDNLRIGYKRNVRFSNVEVYKFGLKQGVDTVPSMGGVSLGMEEHHHEKNTFCLDEYSIYKDAENRIKQAKWESVSNVFHTLQQMRRKRKRQEEKREKGGNTGKKRKLADKAIESSKSSSESEVELEDEMPTQLFEHGVDDSLRRVILANSGVSIDEDIVNESMVLAQGRSQCGCNCRGGKCQPNTCKCAQNGIKCQVDYKDDFDQSSSFPCICKNPISCKNPEGRIEFDSTRIRNHFLQTIMRIKAAEKMGLDGNAESSSPKHIIFNDEDEQHEEGKSDKNGTKKKLKRNRRNMASSDGDE